jgi:hypothetical protein
MNTGNGNGYWMQDNGDSDAADLGCFGANGPGCNNRNPTKVGSIGHDFCVAYPSGGTRTNARRRSSQSDLAHVHVHM